MSKNMRTRNLDPSKPMVIYDAQKDELPDRIDNSGIVRTASSLPTGMEKEEELEHHLQLALTASQKYGDTKTVIIPVPDFMEVEPDIYDRMYPAAYRKNNELYRVQGLSVGPEPDVVDYCIDEDDKDWLDQNAALNITTERFEMAIDRLEKSVGIREPSETDAGKIIKERPEIVTALSKYWITRRKKLKHPLLLKVKTDNKREAASGHDPYVAFRRRAEKMQTRKNRKSDELNYIIMYKLKIAHTQYMNDGLMEILKRMKEREILKIRITEMERHEFHINHCYFDDAYGEQYAHILSAYTQLNLIDSETADDGTHGGEDDEYETGESVEEMSEIYDSDSVETNSWNDMRASGRDDARARSPRYDVENDPNLKDFPAPLVVDPNLVSEAQYNGDEPPEYWGPDGEFTFVPRKDCRYVEEKMDWETESNDVERQLDGFFFQECPVIVKGGSTVMKTVLGCRTIGLGGTRRFVYYKLPQYLESYDLNMIQADSNFEIANLSDNPDWNVFHKYKDRVYKYDPEIITDTSTFPDDPARQALTDAILEDIYQFALTWTPAPADVEPMAPDEEYDMYHVACSSICQPLQEHNYFSPAAVRDLTSRLGDTPDLDMEDIQNLATASELMATAEALAEGSLDPSRNFLDSAPATPLQSEVDSLSSSLDPSQNNPKKRKAPMKTPKTAAKLLAEGITVGPVPVPIKRARPTKAATDATKALNETPKTPRKKAKPNGFVDASENKNNLLTAVMSMPPALPPPIATNVIKTPAVKRSRAPAKKNESIPKTDALLGADPRESAKKPTKRAQSARPVAVKRPRKDEVAMPLPLSLQSPAILKAPQRAILPQPASGTTGTIAGANPASLTFSPTSLRAQSLGGTAASRVTAYQPNLQALLAPSNGISANGFHSAPGSPIVTPNGLGLGITASHSKLI
ncbi:enhancer of polycomb homolog 2-like isoform X2 [Paramacrobiotus metropolitanus]|uniref:enhancer of polycomb homolog 2-like isoform X2 n=1 Tax=Paramacrobiotus metropolitanus TaxID=2943436 RepID=UPI0024465783|nr:enhancer of polycomb homolog 2-like isoform X2 [Paramacrobiotus metropolitanus]